MALRALIEANALLDPYRSSPLAYPALPLTNPTDDWTSFITSRPITALIFNPQQNLSDDVQSLLTQEAVTLEDLVSLAGELGPDNAPVQSAFLEAFLSFIKRRKLNPSPDEF
jgi:hypothetical protein